MTWLPRLKCMTIITAWGMRLAAKFIQTCMHSRQSLHLKDGHDIIWITKFLWHTLMIQTWTKALSSSVAYCAYTITHVTCIVLFNLLPFRLFTRLTHKMIAFFVHWAKLVLMTFATLTPAVWMVFENTLKMVLLLYSAQTAIIQHNSPAQQTRRCIQWPGSDQLWSSNCSVPQNTYFKPNTKKVK